MAIDSSTAGISLDAATASNFTTTAGILTLDGNGGINIVGNADEVDVTTTGVVDINSGAGTWDASTLSLDAIDNSNLTVTGSDKLLTVSAVGGGISQILTLSSAGTGASAIAITATAGGIDVDASDAIIMNAGIASNFTTTSGILTLDGNGGINIVGNADEVDVTTSGAVDINSGAGTWDASTLSLDAIDNSNLTVTGSDKLLTVSAIGGGISQILTLSSAGTGASAITVSSSGGIDLQQAVGNEFVINNNGNDADFRVEGDTDANLLFVDAGSDNIGIGRSAPNGAYKLDVNGDILCVEIVMTSDVRYKQNIETIVDAADKICSMRGVTYKWKDIEGQNFDLERTNIGFIAQEIEEVMPDLVKVDSNGKYAVMYDKVTAVLVEAYKIQKDRMDIFEARLNALENI